MSAKLVRRVVAIACSVVAAAVLAGTPSDTCAAPREDTVDKATVKLFETVHANDFAGVQASIAAGADIEAVDRWGMTPVELAVDHGYYRIAHFLVSVRNSQRSGAGAQPPRPAATVGKATGETPRAASSQRPPTDSRVATRSSEWTSDLTDPASLPATTRTKPGSGPSDAPAWPQGKPNPFDPSVPSPGASLSVIREIH